MSDRLSYPLFFEPQLRHYIWGGRNLEILYGRQLPPGRTAESWEISGHRDAPTVVANGPLTGESLITLVARMGKDLVGWRAEGSCGAGSFPLLVKLLDAQQDLSVQVPPDDDYALTHEPGERGKVETWYVLSAGADARLVYGLRPGIDRSALAGALERGSVADVLAYLPVKPGDCVHVPAGTLHAIMAGTVVVEVQQTSDATYRLFDWGRLGHDGRPREVHIDKALATIRWDSPAPGTVVPRPLDTDNGVRQWELVRCPQYNLDKIELSPGAAFDGHCSGETFEIWGCVEGEATVSAGGEWELAAVRFALLPAIVGRYRISSGSGATLLRAYCG